jgi:carboxypeptidase C (cathepsin A)
MLQGAASMLLMGAGPGIAAEAEKDKKPDAKPEAKTDRAPPPKRVVRELSGTFHGERVTYTATAGETHLKNDKGDPTASVFSTAYIRKPTGDAARRPVAFVFNGGPGSASLWLHLGVFGPKRVVLPDDGGNAGAAPYAFADNADSPLDVADLVFIDPVGTGYSRALGDAKDEDFYGVTADARAIASFIRLWLTENGRWNSPKFLAGESYGTTRAAQIVHEIQTGYDTVALRGVILISSILDFHTAFLNDGNDLPYVAYLPSYAAAAAYHGKIAPKPAALMPFLDEVRAFAAGAYASALLKGSALPGAERTALIKQLAGMTGLSETYLDHSDLRVAPQRFMKELLRDRAVSLGRYDSRSLGQDSVAVGDSPDNDPSLYAIDGAFVAMINDYLGRVLNVGIDRPYKILEAAPSEKWKWSERPEPGGFLNVAPFLGQAMRENRDFRLYVASGLYDLATPFFATELTLAHNGIKADRTRHSLFEAGHMMYTHGPSRDRLTREVRDFMRGV